MTMQEQPPELERGCGTRVLGGVYVETMLGPNGHPLECFMKDPPIALDVNSIGLSSIGVRIVEQNGTTYIFDRVGSQHYPNVADFIEEVRRFGASRRLSKTLDFDKLGPDSKLVLVHDRARYDMTDSMREVMTLDEVRVAQQCPMIVKSMHDEMVFDIQTHLARHQCARHFWYDIDIPKGGAAGMPIEMQMSSFTYRACTRVEMPKYAPGIFLVLPIHRIAVVRDPGTDSHVETIEHITEKLSGSIPLEIVDR